MSCRCTAALGWPSHCTRRGSSTNTGYWCSRSPSEPASGCSPTTRRRRGTPCSTLEPLVPAPCIRFSSRKPSRPATSSCRMAGKPPSVDPGLERAVQMSDGVLTEAYERFHRTGPEWGADQLTNHGPMAVEVLVRRGRAEVVPRWVDAYIRRLDELPRATGEITDASWPEALGNGRRIGDWTAYITRQLAEQPWREVFATWWPRLLPGIAAGATHGVIRTGHVVRTLLTTEDNAPTLDELGHALAFWAARSR